MLVKCFGSVRDASALQPRNALSPKRVQVSGSVMEVRETQPENAPDLIVCTPSGTTIVVTSYGFPCMPTTALPLIYKAVVVGVSCALLAV